MTQKLKLIFVHIPKTGGNTVRTSIVDHFSAPRVLRDYDDRPDDPSAPMNIDPEGFLERAARARAAELAGKAAVVGHFWIRKYDSVGADVRATILREPLARAMSHYFYWMKRTEHGQALHDYVMQHKLTFLDFVRLPAIRYFYTRTFFRDVDMGQFNVIGCFERCVQNWGEFLKSLGLKANARVRHLNATAELDEQYEEHRRAILEDADLVARLRELLARDIEFYERHAAARR
jgi:hypothetical protein